MESEGDLKAIHAQDAARLLYGNNFSGLFISAIACSVLVFGFHRPEAENAKLIWWGVMMAILTARLLDTLWWREHRADHTFNGQRNIQRFAIGAMCTALLWSTYSLYFYHGASLPEVTTNIIVVSAMAGGASNILAGNRWIAMAYSGILLIPYSLLLLSADEHYHFLLGFLGLFFAAIMLISAYKSAAFTTETIRLKHQNRQLLNHMEAQVIQRTLRIYELSNLDPLTGLFNRAAFLEQLRDRLHGSRHVTSVPVALLFVDLDGFKKVNDSIGHDVGDVVLKQTAERLRHHCDDMLLCRWGGDEFLVVQPFGQETDIQRFALSLIDSISQPCLVNGNQLMVGATVGVAIFPWHSRNENELIQLADMAMYAQKRRAPSQVGFFDAPLAEQLRREMYLRDRLHHAIERRELRLVYQPVLNEHNDVVAVEALLRWRTEGVDIAPVEFIPIAEQTGLIRVIGNWVLHEACTTIQPLGNLAVGVNVSVLQFQDEDFVTQLQTAADRSNIALDRVHLEITESIFAPDRQLLIQHLSAVQQLGVQVSIDDFGTGYSSLSAIQELAVNVVKIDRTFVATMDTTGGPIIEAVMQIANALRCQVVAEGVETENQARRLHAMGIHYQQGYWHSRPLEVPQLVAFLAAHQSSTTQQTL